MLFRQLEMSNLVKTGIRRGLIHPHVSNWEKQTRDLVALCVDRGFAHYNGPAPVFNEDKSAEEKQRKGQRDCMRRIRAARNNSKTTSENIKNK